MAKKRCKLCRKKVNEPYICDQCGHKFCGTHRLLENHNCGQLKLYINKVKNINKTKLLDAHTPKSILEKI